MGNNSNSHNNPHEDNPLESIRQNDKGDLTVGNTDNQTGYTAGNPEGVAGSQTGEMRVEKSDGENNTTPPSQTITETEEKKKQPRKIPLLVCLILLLLGGGGVYGWYFITRKLIPLLEESLSEYISRPVKLGSVERVSPTGVSFGKTFIHKTQTDNDYLVAESVTVTINPLDLLNREIKLNIHLNNVRTFLQRDEDGKWLKLNLKPKPSTLPLDFNISVNEIRLTNQYLTVKSNPKDNTHLNFRIPQLTIQPAKTNLLFNSTIFLQTGEKVTVEGLKKFDDRKWQLKVNASLIPTAIINQLNLFSLPITLDNGRISALLDLKLKQDGLEKIKGSIQLQGVDLTIPRLPKPLSATSGKIQLADKQILLQQVNTNLGLIPLVASGVIKGKQLNLQAKIKQPVGIGDVISSLRLPKPKWNLAGKIKGEVSVYGKPEKPIIKGNIVNHQQVKVDRIPLHSLAANITIADSLLTIDKLQLKPQMGGEIAAKGKIVLDKKNSNYHLDIESKNIPAGKLTSLYQQTPPIPIGKVVGNYKLSGNWQKLEDFRLTGFFQLQTSGGKAKVNNLQLNRQSWQADVKVFGISLKEIPFIDCEKWKCDNSHLDGFFHLLGDTQNPAKTKLTGNFHINYRGSLINLENTSIQGDYWQTVVKTQGLDIKKLPWGKGINLQSPSIPLTDTKVNANLILGGKIRDMGTKSPASSGDRIISIRGKGIIDSPQGKAELTNISLNGNQLKAEAIIHRFSLPKRGYWRGEVRGKVNLVGDVDHLTPGKTYLQGELKFSKGFAAITKPLEITFSWNGKYFKINRGIVDNWIAKGIIAYDYSENKIKNLDLDITGKGISLSKLPLPSQIPEYRGKFDFDGNLRGDLSQPRLKGNVILSDFRLAGFNFSPLKGNLEANSGEITLSLKSENQQEKLLLRLNPDFSPHQIYLRHGETTIAGMTPHSSPHMSVDLSNIPLATVFQSTRHLLPANIRDIKISGSLSGRVELNVKSLNLLTSRLTIRKPSLNHWQGDTITAELIREKEAINIVNGNLTHQNNQYLFQGKLLPLKDKPSLRLAINLPPTDIQPLLTSWGIFEFEDIPTIFQSRRYASAKDLYISPQPQIPRKDDMSFQPRKYTSLPTPLQSNNTPQSKSNNGLSYPLPTTFHEKPQWILVFPTSTDKKIISSGNIPVSSKSQLASDNLITSLSPQTTTPPSPSTVSLAKATSYATDISVFPDNLTLLSCPTFPVKETIASDNQSARRYFPPSDNQSLFPSSGKTIIPQEKPLANLVLLSPPYTHKGKNETTSNEGIIQVRDNQWQLTHPYLNKQISQQSVLVIPPTNHCYSYFSYNTTLFSDNQLNSQSSLSSTPISTSTFSPHATSLCDIPSNNQFSKVSPLFSNDNSVSVFSCLVNRVIPPGNQSAYPPSTTATNNLIPHPGNTITPFSLYALNKTITSDKQPMLPTRENPFASSSDKQLVIVSPRDIVFTPSDKQTLPVSPTTYFLDKSSLSSVAKKGNITASSDKQSASVSNPDRISNGGNNPSLLSTYPSTVNDSSVSWDKNNQSVLLSPPTTSVLSYSSTNNNNYFFPLVFPPSDKPSASSSTYLFGNLTIPPATLNTTTSNFWDNQSVLVSSSENVITPSNSYGGSGNRWESILVFPPTTLTTSLANQSVFASSPHNNSPPHPLVLVSNTGNVTTLADDSAIVNTTLFSKNNSESLLLSLPTKETEDKSLILSSTPTDNTRQSFGKATFSSSPPSTTHTSINPDNRYFTVSSSLFSTGNPPISLNKASISSDKSSLSVSSSKTVIIAEKKPSLSASFSKNTITLSDKQPLIIPPPKIAACVVDNQSINSQLKLDNQLASLSPCIDSLATLSPYPLINVFPPHKPSFSPSSPTGEGFVSLGNTSSLKSPFGSQAFVYSDEYLALINDSSSKVAPSDNQSPLVSLYNNQSALVSLPNSKGDNRRLLAFPSFPPNQSKLASVSYPSTVKTITLADSKSAKPSGFPNENLLASVSPLSTAKKPSSTLPSPVSVFGLQPSYTTFTPDNQSVLIFPGGNSTFPYNQPSASISITPSFLFSPNKTTIFSNNNLFNGNYGIGGIYANKSDSKSTSVFPSSNSIILSDKPSVGVSFGNNRLITSSTSVSPRKTTDKTTTASDNYSANNNINPLPGNNKIIPLASQWLWRHPDGDMTASSNSHSKSVSVFPLDNSNTPLPPPPPTNPTTSDNPVMSLFYPSLLGITDKTTIPLEKLLVIPPNRLTIPYSGKNPTILSLSELFDSQPPLVSPPNPDNQSALASSFFKIILTPENQQLLVSYYKNKTTPQNPLAAGLSTYGSSNGNSNGNGNSSQTTNNQAATISSLFLPPYNSSIKSSLSSGKTIFSPASQSILSRGKQLSFLNNNPTGLSLSQSSITTVTKPPDKTLTVCLLPFLNSTTSCNKPKATISSPSQLPHTITAISGVNPPLFEINTDNQSLFKTFERITQTRRLLETRRKKYSQNNFPPLQQLEGKLGGVVNLDLSRKGLVAKFDFSTSQWQWGKYSGDSIRVAGSYRNGLLTLLPVTINSHGGIISLTGTIGEENISASLVLSDVSLSQWQDLLASTNVRVDGLLNANVVVSGSRKNPLARGSVEVSNFRINGNEMDKTNATFFLKNSRLDFSASSNLTTPSESLRIFGGFPFQLFPQSVKPETDAFFMDLALNRDGFNLLNVITNNQLNWLAGDGKVTVKIHGNYNQTRNEITFLVAEGIATVENGIVGGSWLANSVIDNIHGKILFDLNRLTIPLFTASFNGSKIAVNGSLPFVSPSDANNSLLVAVGDVNVNLNHLYSGNANALVNIHGSLLFPKIGGQINLAKGIIWVGDDSSKVWQNRGNNRLFNRVKLENLFLTLGEGISVVKPPLIDLKVAGNIVLNGEFGNLKPEGVVRLTGGSVNLFTSRLSLAKDYNHIAKFTPENGFNPYVDLLLEGRIFESSRHQFLDKSNPQEIDDSPYFYIDTGEFVRIRAHLNGWLNNNRDIPLYFSSSPRRSQGEILALLGGGFFGNPSPTDTSLSIAGLASTALFTGIHGEIQNSTGFDSLRFFPTRISSSDNRTSLGLGAELAFDFTDSLSFSAIRILTSPLPTRYNLRYRLSPIFSLRTSSDFQRHFLLLLEASSRF